MSTFDPTLQVQADCLTAGTIRLYRHVGKQQMLRNNPEERRPNWRRDVSQESPNRCYEGESNVNFRSAIKILNTAQLSCKLQLLYWWFEEWPTGGSTMQECNTTAQ